MVANSYDDDKEYMFIDGSKVYFWDSNTDKYQLNFDFQEVSDYSIPWEGRCDNDTGTLIVHVDSITSLTIQGDNIAVQHLSMEGEGSVPFVDVYNNIGLAFGGLRFPVGIGLCDFERHITKLRCFESETVNYKFVNYPCDSIWFTTSIADIEKGKPILYPNPSNGQVQLHNVNGFLNFELFDVNGKLIQKSGVIDNKVIIESKGFFILKLIGQENIYTFKIIVF